MATKKKTTPAKKSAPAKSAPAKAPAKAAAPAKPVAPSTKPATPVNKKSSSDSSSSAKGSKAPLNASELKRMLLERKAAPKAIAFTLDEVREIAQKNEKQLESTAKSTSTGKTSASAKQAELAAKLEKNQKPNHVKAASLADILGFNPAKGKQRSAMVDESEVPEKFRRYYRLLLDLRMHVLTQLGEHTEETLLKSAKDDSGDLSGYGQHMADAGTDTFDRDFALSLVSNEQEALSEIEAAIKRIHDGTYGVCESTQKPISKERLLAVPFTRYSAEAKKEVERYSHRSQQRGGLFSEASEDDASKLAADDSGDE